MQKTTAQHAQVKISTVGTGQDNYTVAQGVRLIEVLLAAAAAAAARRQRRRTGAQPTDYTAPDAMLPMPSVRDSGPWGTLDREGDSRFFVSSVVRSRSTDPCRSRAAKTAKKNPRYGNAARMVAAFQRPSSPSKTLHSLEHE